MVDGKVEKVFFALLRAGLWEKEVRLLSFDDKDLPELLRLAREQSVVGLVAAGLEHVTDVKVPKEDVLQLIGRTVQLEQRNKAMNAFIGRLVDKMRESEIYTLLVKGQGVAQCYERPLWRTCGDVDLFLSDENYEKAKTFLIPLAAAMEPEGVYAKHLEMVVDSWVVELHGRLYNGLSSRIDSELDDVYRDSFRRGKVRSWMNGDVQVFQLSAENDAFYVFTHILQHFYKGGIGLRQICDWCRLLWTYRDEMNRDMLEGRLRRTGLMTAWKAFGAFAVEYLGMEAAAVPFLNDNVNLNLNDNLNDNVNLNLKLGGSISARLKQKAARIKEFVLESGNFGHNRDMSYYSKYPYVIRKCMSMSRRVGDLIRHSRIFPMDSLRFFPRMMLNGVRSAMRGE